MYAPSLKQINSMRFSKQFCQQVYKLIIQPNKLTTNFLGYIFLNEMKTSLYVFDPLMEHMLKALWRVAWLSQYIFICWMSQKSNS